MIIVSELAQLDFWDSPQSDRDALFGKLRAAEEPIYCPLPDGTGFYALTRYDQVLFASKNPDLFSSEPIATSLDDPPASVMEFAGSIISMDSPRHTRLRRIVARGFTPRMVERTIDGLRTVAREIVDDLRDQRAGEFVSSVAVQMPLRVICRMLGVPRSMWDQLVHSTDSILAIGDPEYAGSDGEDRETALLRKYSFMHEVARELTDLRRREPADDLVTALTNANVDGEALTVEELGKFFTLLLVAGVETTSHAISHALTYFTDHPAQRALLLSDVPRYIPGAVEEVVRYATPTTWMRRTVTKDVELDGRTYSEGDRVVMFYYSANRDESVFTAPHDFDITRSPNPHLSFGAPGPHFCLGAHLARQEIAVLLGELFSRLPDIHATGPAVRHRSSFVNGVQSLQYEFSTR